MLLTTLWLTLIPRIFRFARFIHCACNFYIDDNMCKYATLIDNFNCCSLCAHKPRGWASGLGQPEKKCGKARTLVSFSPGKERAHCHTYVPHHNVVSTHTATRTTILPHSTHRRRTTCPTSGFWALYKLCRPTPHNIALITPQCISFQGFQELFVIILSFTFFSGHLMSSTGAN